MGHGGKDRQRGNAGKCAERGATGVCQADVATATGLSLPTIKRVESDREVPVSAEAQAAVRGALEAAGVEFTNGDRPGVRLRKGGED